MKRAAYALSVLLCGAALWAQVSPGQHGPLGPFKPGVIIDTTSTSAVSLTSLVAVWTVPTFTAATNAITAWANAGGSCGATCDLGATNTPLATGGATGLGLNNVAASSQGLSVADAAAFSGGQSKDFLFCGWVRPATLPASHLYWAHDDAASSRSFAVIGNNTGQLAFYAWSDTDALSNANIAAAVSAGVQSLICLAVDISEKKVGGSKNAAAFSYGAAWASGTDLKNSTASLELGMRGAGTIPFDGVIDSAVLYIGTTLDFASIATALYNSGKGQKCAQVSTTNLVSCWDLDETSGTRTSDAGTCGTACDLAPTNTPGAAAGLVETRDTQGNTSVGAKLASASSQYLSVADNASLSMGDISFSVSCWYNPAAVGSAVTLMAKGTEYQLGVNASDQATFLVDTTTATDLAPTQSANTWYMVTGVRDKGTALNVTLNNGTFVTATDDTAADGAAAFALGSLSTPGTYANGVLASCSVWKRVLTQGEVTTLYNSGAGRYYDYAWWLMLRDPVRWAFRVLFDPFQTLSRTPDFEPYAGA